MPQGPRYYVGDTLNVYNTAADAISHTSPRSTLTDTSNSVEGAGTPYIDNFSGWDNYLPAIPIWFMPSWGGSGYNIGWVNDDDNGGFARIGNASGTPVRGRVWIGNASGVPVKAKAIYVGNASGVPTKGK